MVRTVERPAAEAAGAGGGRARLLAALTALHTINDFYGLILAPLLPALREAFGLSYGQLGVVPFVGTAVSSLLQPTLGYAADRRRARARLMVAGFVGYAVAMLCLGAASSYPVVLLAAVTGLGLAATFGFLVWLPSYYGAKGFSLTQAGLLTSAMVAAGLAAQPAGGVLSDRYGRRAVILLSLVGVGAFQLLFLASNVLPLVVGLSLLAGFFGSLMAPVTMVYASELAAEGRTGTAVGVVWGLGISLSSVAPLVSGAVIDRYGFVAAYVGLSLLALVAALLALWLPSRGGEHAARVSG